MIVIRRRLLFWLIKAYLKRSGKIIALSFIAGLVFFFCLLSLSKYFSRFIVIHRKVIVGLVGAYKANSLPPEIVNRISEGLTSIASDGSVKPAVASSWSIRDNGKTYVFYLKHNKYFSDGKNVTSDLISYDFSDVDIERPDKYTMIFKIHVKNGYAPFLVTLAKPIFEDGFIGVGDYRIENVKLNGDFVQSLSIASVKNQFDIIQYQFYPTQDALKTAFLLGEITEAHGITNPNYSNYSFNKFSNAKLQQTINYSHLVTLFYNTTDGLLSDNKMRLALTYALPDDFEFGQRAYIPYPQNTWYANKDLEDPKQDFNHAKLLFNASVNATESGKVEAQITIKTLTKYKKAADTVAKEWNKIGILTKVEEVDSIPIDFQVYLGEFNLAQDPDQYTIWHSGQTANISRYKDLRIDKYLEDGRTAMNINTRQSIYFDFQKYLLEDPPAAFLYFPYEYKIIRK